MGNKERMRYIKDILNHIRSQIYIRNSGLFGIEVHLCASDAEALVDAYEELEHEKDNYWATLMNFAAKLPCGHYAAYRTGDTCVVCRATEAEAERDEALKYKRAFQNLVARIDMDGGQAQTNNPEVDGMRSELTVIDLLVRLEMADTEIARLSKIATDAGSKNE